MYIYESHLGCLYTREEKLTFDSLYCDTCGDSDTYLGYANTKKEAKKLLPDYYTKEYIKEFLEENFK